MEIKANVLHAQENARFVSGILHIAYFASCIFKRFKKAGGRLVSHFQKCNLRNEPRQASGALNSF